MKGITAIIILIAACTNVQAQGPGGRPGLDNTSACGYWLVNTGSELLRNIISERALLRPDQK